MSSSAHPRIGSRPAIPLTAAQADIWLDQQISPVNPLIVDLRAQDVLDKVAAAWMREDLRPAADLTTGPLFAQALLRLKDNRVVWYQRYHHIVTDGFGVAVMARAVALTYSDDVLPAAADGRSLSRLVAIDAVLCVATVCRYRGLLVWTGRGGRHPALPGGHCCARRIRAQGHRESDLVLAFPVAARPLAELRAMPGVVSVILPLRVTVPPEASFVDLIRIVDHCMQLASRAKSAFNADLTPRDVLTARTVSALAKLVEKILSELKRVAVVPETMQKYEVRR
jgi:Condensation domain